MTTRIIKASWELSARDVKDSKSWSGGVPGREFNNMSLRRKNEIRKTRRANRQAVKQADKDLCAYEDKLFMDILRKQV